MVASLFHAKKRFRFISNDVRIFRNGFRNFRTRIVITVVTRVLKFRNPFKQSFRIFRQYILKKNKFINPISFLYILYLNARAFDSSIESFSRATKVNSQ